MPEAVIDLGFYDPDMSHLNSQGEAYAERSKHPLLWIPALKWAGTNMESVRGPGWHYHYQYNDRYHPAFTASRFHRDDFEGTWMILWANQNPTIVRHRGQIIPCEPKHVYAINNRLCGHRAPELTKDDFHLKRGRWFMRVHVQPAMLRMTSRAVDQIRIEIAQNPRPSLVS